MRIEVKGRNTPVTDEIRSQVERRFAKVAKQVSSLAEMEVELSTERNPSIAASQIAEVTLHLKGVTLRAKDASPDMDHSIKLCSEELSRQVKRHRDKRRKRRESRSQSGLPESSPAT
jgi:putative sigma-54 modulation protein